MVTDGSSAIEHLSYISGYDPDIQRYNFKHRICGEVRTINELMALQWKLVFKNTTLMAVLNRTTSQTSPDFELLRELDEQNDMLTVLLLSLSPDDGNTIIEIGSAHGCRGPHLSY